MRLNQTLAGLNQAPAVRGQKSPKDVRACEHTAKGLQAVIRACERTVKGLQAVIRTCGPENRCQGLLVTYPFDVGDWLEINYWLSAGLRGQGEWIWPFPPN